MENLNEFVVYNLLNNKKIQVQGSEGNEPHIHITLNGKIICRIKLFTNEYTEESVHDIKLTSKEAKELNRLLNEIDGKSGKTKWENLIDYWITANPETKVDLTKKPKEIPDYSHINSDSKGKAKNLREEMDQLYVLIDKLNKDIENMRNKK